MLGLQTDLVVSQTGKYFSRLILGISHGGKFRNIFLSIILYVAHGAKRQRATVVEAIYFAIRRSYHIVIHRTYDVPVGKIGIGHKTSAHVGVGFMFFARQ